MINIPAEIIRHIGLYCGLTDKLTFRLVIKNIYPCCGNDSDIIPRIDETLFQQANSWHLPPYIYTYKMLYYDYLKIMIPKYYGFYDDNPYSFWLNDDLTENLVRYEKLIKQNLELLDNPWGLLSINYIEQIVIDAYRYIRSTCKITSYIHDLLLDEVDSSLKATCDYKRISLNTNSTNVDMLDKFNKIMNVIKRDHQALASFIKRSISKRYVIQFDDIFVPEYLQYPKYTEMLFLNLMCMKISLMYNFVHIKYNDIMDIYLGAIKRCGHECVMNANGCIYYAWTYGYVPEHEKFIIDIDDKMKYYSSLKTHKENSVALIINYHGDVFEHEEDFEYDLRENEENEWTSLYKIIGVHGG